MTTKQKVTALAVLAALWCAAGYLQQRDMQKCMLNHSEDTCFYSLNH